jgi:hypothetical protein
VVFDEFSGGLLPWSYDAAECVGIRTLPIPQTAYSFRHGQNEKPARLERAGYDGERLLLWFPIAVFITPTT